MADFALSSDENKVAYIFLAQEPIARLRVDDEFRFTLGHRQAKQRFCKPVATSKEVTWKVLPCGCSVYQFRWSRCFIFLAFC